MSKNYIIFLIFLSICVIACKNENSANHKEIIATENNIEVPSSESDSDTNLVIPDPCGLVSLSDIKTMFKMKTDPAYNPGSSGNKNERSCFFRVDDAKSNGAILLQISSNPVPLEMDNYPIAMIKSKLQQGEQDPQTGKTAIYSSLPELGDMGCYNFAMGKYHWQYNGDYLFMLAFNTSINEKDQKTFAIEIAKTIQNNFTSLNK
jgi:hypothetical protein